MRQSFERYGFGRFVASMLLALILVFEQMPSEALAEALSDTGNGAGDDMPVMVDTGSGGDTGDGAVTSVPSQVANGGDAVGNVAGQVPADDVEEVVEPRRWSVSFDANGGSFSEEPKPWDVVEGAVVGPVSDMGASREGYRLVGWATTRDGRDVADDPETEADEHVRCGIVFLGTSLVDLSYNYVELREGDDGWEEARRLADGRRIAVVGDGLAVGSKDDLGRVVKCESLAELADAGGALRLMALWEPISYTVGFDCGEVSVNVPSDVVATFDRDVTLPGVGPVDGRRLVGWSLPDGSVAAAGDVVRNLLSDDGGRVVLSAVWESMRESGAGDVPMGTDFSETGTDGAPSDGQGNVSAGGSAAVVDKSSDGSGSSASVGSGEPLQETSSDRVSVADGDGTDRDALIVDGDGSIVPVPDVMPLQSRGLSAEVVEGDVPKGADVSDDAGGGLRSLLAAPLRNGSNSELPRSLDGSNVESLTLRWVTADTVDDGIDDHLYLRPSSDAAQSARARISYDLSGEHDYMPGDVRISIPISIFSKRGGGAADRLRLPFPEDPDSSAKFMWHVEGDRCVLVNTGRMSAASKGFLEVAYDGVVPHEVMDHVESGPLSADITVTTHLGNEIGLSTQEMRATVDTEQVVDDATKRLARKPQWVSAGVIPSQLRVPGETEYVVVDWSVYAHVQGNTLYSMDMADVMDGRYGGFVLEVVDGNGRHTVPSSRSASITVANVATGVTESGNRGMETVRVAYPGSQFEPDINYVFENSVTYTLTENDPEIGDDPRLVTTATETARTSWSWRMPVFYDPTGHFMVNKMGNDGHDGRSPMPYFTHSYRWDYTALDTTCHNTDDGYGIYPSALNEILDGDDVEVGYTVESIGYVLPWTCVGDYRQIGNYGRRPVTMVTTDEDEDVSVKLGNVALECGADYDYKAVEFPKVPTIGRGVAINLNEDGSFTAIHAEDGAVEYERDDDVTHIPPVTLSAQVGETWVDVARASWTTGDLSITLLAPGASVVGNRVSVPVGTKRVRTSVETTNGYIWYYVRPILELHASERVRGMAESAFEASSIPSVIMDNSCRMRAFEDNGDEICDIAKTGSDEIRGYTTDVWVYPEKTSEQSLDDVDLVRQRTTIHYSAQFAERTLISDESIYEEALAEGRIVPEEEGVFWDLLPKEVVPQTDTVRLRDGDRVTDVHTVENWRGTGRTMLVVKADLSPSPTTYEDSGVRYWEDVPTISFDATYDLKSWKDFGADVHNVIAFESLSRERLGTVDDYGGESDNARGTNNIATARACATDLERDAMTGLDSSHPGERFAYAGVDTHVDVLSAGETSLFKEVQVNGDGIWGTGVGDEDFRVFEGGLYQYRLRMLSDPDTQSKDLVLYDSLENFHAGQGNDAADIDAPRWRGRLRGVDVSQLEAAGVAPVVYYSLVDELQLSDEQDPDVGHPTNLNLSDRSIWVPASDYTGDLSRVHAIAVDCSHARGGGDFVLDEMESIAVLVNMWAPWGDEASGYIAEDAHAYNNVYLTSTSIDIDTGVEDHGNFTRKDYTKVGLFEHDIPVTKKFDDDDNRDGIRPSSVSLTLLMNGSPYATATVEPDAATGAWTHTFEHVPYTDQNGDKAIWSIREDAVPGYEAEVTRSGDGFVVTNVHEPELVSLQGRKTWSGDDESVRPDYVVVSLMAETDAVARHAVASSVVRADARGEWGYSFVGMHRYEAGEEIRYSVEETVHPSAYVPHATGMDIENRYHPFGDIVLSKTVVGGTAAFASQEFEVRLDFSDGDGAPVMEMFRYDVERGGSVVSSGSVSCGGSVRLCGGDVVRIHEVPEGTRWSFEEVVPEGYEVTGSSGLTGTVVANVDNTASIENTYHAAGSATLLASKVLTGRAIVRNQFRFRVEDGAGNLLRSGANAADGSVRFGDLRYTEADAGHVYSYRIVETDRGKAGYTYDDAVFWADVTVTDNGDGTLSTSVAYRDGDGGSVDLPAFENSYTATGSVNPRVWKVLTGGRKQRYGEFLFDLIGADGQVVATARNTVEGIAVFDALTFDQDDAGQTFHYTLRERVGSDATVVYDDTVYAFDVKVTDNGDGTLACTTEAREMDECPTCSGTGTSPEDSQVPCSTCAGIGRVPNPSADVVQPTFENSLVDGALSITKTVPSDTPADKADTEFRFKVQLTGENVPDSIEYSLVPIGATVVPGATEGSDVLGWLRDLLSPRVAYADSTETYSVTYDAGEGSFAGGGKTNVVGYSRHVYDQKVSHTANVSDSGSSSTGYASNLATTEVVTMPGAKELVVNLRYATYGAVCSVVQGAYSGPVTSSSPEVGDGVWQFSGGGRYYQDRTELRVPGDTVTFCFWSSSGSSNSYYGYYATVNAEDVVSVVSGAYEDPSPSGARWFMDGSDVAVDATDVHEDATLHAVWGARARGMFQGLPWHVDDAGALIIGDGGSYTVATTPRSGMQWPWASIADQITSARVDGDVHVTGSTANMFNGCVNMTSVDLTGLDTSGVVDMGSMFRNCDGLTSFDFSQLDMSGVMFLSDMFSDCDGITSVNLTSSNLSSAVVDARDGWYSCDSLVTVDMRGLDFSNGTISWMFNSCANLETVDARGSRFIDGSAAFQECPKLRLLDLRNCVIGRANNSYSGFTGFISGSGRDSDWFEVDARNAVFKGSVSYMFRGSDDVYGSMSSVPSGGIRKIDLTGADFSEVNSANYFIAWNANLEVVLAPEIDLGNCQRATSVFAYCPSVTLLDAHGANIPSCSGYMFQYTGGLKSRDGVETLIDLHGSTIGGSLNSAFTYNRGINIDMSGCDLSTVMDSYQMLGGSSSNSGATDVTIDLSGSKMPARCYYMLSSNRLTEVDLEGVDTSDTVDFSYMFCDTSSLESANLESFDFSSAQRVDSMFMYSGIKHVDMSDKAFNPDSSGPLFRGASSMETLDFSGATGINRNHIQQTFDRDAKLWRIHVPDAFDFAGSELPEPPVDDTYNGQWLHLDDGAVMTSAELMAAGPTWGTWVWDGTPTWEVRYDPNGGGGSAITSRVIVGEDGVVQECEFRLADNDFVGWNTASDGSGTTYMPGDTIARGRAGDVTLYAQWARRSHSVDITNGSFEVVVPAGYRLTIGDLPAGTSYVVSEESEDGWVMTSASGVAGTIRPLVTADAAFENQYQAGMTSAQIVGVKALDGMAPADGAFSFGLWEGDTLVETVSNGSGGSISFSPIVYDAPGVHEYEVREVIPIDDGGVDYVRDPVHVTVDVSRTKTGALAAGVTYEGGQLRFDNVSRPGMLRVNKRVEGGSEANANDEFTFTVRLRNPDGRSLDDVVMNRVTGAVGLQGEDGVDVLGWLVSLFRPREALALTTDWTRCGSCEWHVEDGVLTIRPEDGGASGTLDPNAFAWTTNSSAITSVRFEGSVMAPSCKGMFEYMSGVKSFDFTGLDTSSCYDFSRMFHGCAGFEGTLDVSGLDVSNARTMESMFDSCLKLNSVNMTGWDTSKVTTMRYMFGRSPELGVIDVSEFNMEAVRDIYGMFYSCRKAEVDASGWHLYSIASADNTSNFSYYGVKSLVAKNWVTGSLTSIRNLFGSDYTESIDLSGSVFNSVNTLGSAFYDMDALKSLDLSGVQFPAASDCSYMFYGCSSLEDFSWEGADFNDYARNFSGMFYGCSSLTTLDMAPLAGCCAGGLNLSSMFSDCSSLVTLTMSGFGSSCTMDDMHSTFARCSSLQYLDLRGWRGSGITSMQGAFDECNSMTLDISGWVLYPGGSSNIYPSMNGSEFRHLIARNVTFCGGISYYLFCENCNNLETVDLSGSTFRGVTSLGQMFYSCDSLRSINLDGVNTEGVQNMNNMFDGCSSLQSLDLSDVDTASVTTALTCWNGMSALEYLDVSNFVKGAGLSPTGWDFKLSDYSHPNLRTIKVSSGFQFSERGINTPKHDDVYTGEWLHVESGDTFTADELRTMPNEAGTYTWATYDGVGKVLFDANGGRTDGVTVTFGDDGHPVTMPDATRDGYEFLGWNSKPDGSGPRTFEAGRTYDDEFHVGETVTLYAQWKTNVGYTVRQWCQNEDLSTYSLYSAREYEAHEGDEVHVEPTAIAGYVTPEGVTITVTGDPSVDYVDLRYDRKPYWVEFDGNGADMGHMDVQQLLIGLASRLAPNAFVRLGAMFVGWATAPDGDVTYTDRQRVLDLADEGGTANLFARWQDLPSVGAETDGSYTFTLKANETMELRDLPAGTTYEIVESDLPSGWVLTTSEGDLSGTVSADESKDVFVWNRYSGTGEFSVTAWKRLYDRIPSPGEFSFEMRDGDGNVVSSATNGSVDVRDEVMDGDHTVPNPHKGDAPITFGPIQVDSVGTYSYTLREVAGTDPDIDYDTSAVGVTVEVKDAGHGNLTCDVRFDGGDDMFENRLESGVLTLTKDVEGVGSTSAAFTFDVDLRDADGNPLSARDVDVVRESGRVPSGAHVWTEGSASPGEGGRVVEFFSAGGAFGGSGDANRVVYDGSGAVVSGTYEEPTRDGSTFAGWRVTGDDGSFETVSDVSGWLAGSDVSGKVTMQALWSQVASGVSHAGHDVVGHVTFDANGGTFSGDAASNVVTYGDVSSRTERRVWHTANLLDDGTKFSEMASSTYEFGGVSIPGAKTLHVSLRYSVPRGYVCVWDGNRMPISSFDDQTSTSTATFIDNSYDANGLGSLRTQELDIASDGVTFVNYSYAMPKSSEGYSEMTTNYGLFAEVTSRFVDYGVIGGAYEEPTGPTGTRFVGWFTDPTCAPGTEFDVSSHEFSDGEDVTLWAGWTDVEPVVDGRVTVTLGAGETARIEGLPAGSTWQVRERDLVGWDQVSSSGISGTVTAGGVGSATFVNRYAAEGSFDVHATKSLVFGDLSGGEFSFEMRDEHGSLVSRASNDASGDVAFTGIPITPDMVGTEAVYTICEVEGSDPRIAYDTHVGRVTARFSDDGTGRLVATLSSADGDLSFVNRVMVDMPATGRRGDVLALMAAAGIVAVMVASAWAARRRLFSRDESMS